MDDMRLRRQSVSQSVSQGERSGEREGGSRSGRERARIRFDSHRQEEEKQRMRSRESLVRKMPR
eukprot:768766-Hanusia_phi.AAC.2